MARGARLLSLPWRPWLWFIFPYFKLVQIYETLNTIVEVIGGLKGLSGSGGTWKHAGCFRDLSGFPCWNSLLKNSPTLRLNLFICDWRVNYFQDFSKVGEVHIPRPGVLCLDFRLPLTGTSPFIPSWLSSGGFLFPGPILTQIWILIFLSVHLFKH